MTVTGESFPGAPWRKSRHSNPNGACVEAADVPGGVGVRDSTDRSGTAIVFERTAFAEFIGKLKA